MKKRNISHYFDSHEYDVISAKQIKNVMRFEIVYFKDIQANYESVVVRFDVDEEDNIRIIDVKTHAYFDEERPRRQCLICGSNDLIQDKDYEDSDPNAVSFYHSCGFDKDILKRFIKECYEQEMLPYTFSEEAFQNDWSVMMRDDSKKSYVVVDEWLGMNTYLIKSGKVYHCVPAWEDEEYCPFCSSMKVTEEGDGMRYRLCPVLTKHVSLLLSWIQKRDQDEAKLSHEERLSRCSS